MFVRGRNITGEKYITYPITLAYPSEMARRGIDIATGNIFVSRRDLVIASGLTGLLAVLPVRAATPLAVRPQPFFASVDRVRRALSFAGQPMATDVAKRLDALAAQGDGEAVIAAQRLLDTLVLVDVVLDARGHAASLARGGSAGELVEQGWRAFLVLVENPGELTRPLALSLDLASIGEMERRSSQQSAHAATGWPTPAIAEYQVGQRRMALEMVDMPPMMPGLSGLAVDYRIVQLLALDRGPLSATVLAQADAVSAAAVGQNGVRLAVSLKALPSRDISFAIKDVDGAGTIAALTIRDTQDRVYPSRHGRMAPDMFFQDHVYRADGETIRLPDGEYRLHVTRGPEYLPGEQVFQVGEGRSTTIPLRLRRWIDPAAHGWYSGDVHIHASGCSHYTNPTIGVDPETMIRHVRGEGLWIGQVLTWGPGWHEQKRFFTGAAASPAHGLEHAPLQAAHRTSLVPRPTPHDRDSLLRYDVEVSGFPSSPSGHMILLGLKDMHYPGTTDPTNWPSWALPIMRWAKAQGAVIGYAHIGHGIAVPDVRPPGWSIPRFDGVGANEYLLDVAHDAVDFLAGGDCNPVSELTLWYHALNCGFRTWLVGETDWPCMTDDRVGGGRTYVRLDNPPQDDAGYRAWLEGLRLGRCYMGDGRSHIVDFSVAGTDMGEELRRDGPGTVRARAKVAAWLDPGQSLAGRDIARSNSWEEPNWHIERARLEGSREVDVEFVVNGAVAAKRRIVADGRVQEIEADIALPRSSWIAMRVFPSVHSQPVFAIVGDKPIRASRASADWCLACLDVLERTRVPQIAVAERAEAAEAYRVASERFRQIAAECSA